MLKQINRTRPIVDLLINLGTCVRREIVNVICRHYAAANRRRTEEMTVLTEGAGYGRNRDFCFEERVIQRLGSNNMKTTRKRIQREQKLNQSNRVLSASAVKSCRHSQHWSGGHFPFFTHTWELEMHWITLEKKCFTQICKSNIDEKCCAMQINASSTKIFSNLSATWIKTFWWIGKLY